MLSLRTVRLYLKPPLFLLCALPAVGVVAGAGRTVGAATPSATGAAGTGASAGGVS